MSLNHLCRACGNETLNLQNLFGAALNSMLEEITRLKVTEDDGLPQKMCRTCIIQVSRAFQFKELCIRSDKKFKEILNNDSQQKSIQVLISDVQKAETENFMTEPDHESDNFLDHYIAERSFHSLSYGDLTNEDNSYDDPLIQINRSPSVTLVATPLPIQTPIKPKTYECNVCKKQFYQVKILLRHHKTHLLARFKCNECGRIFADKSNLTKHLKSHTGELRNIVGKPHLCSQCGKSFKWRSSLIKHTRHHTKNKIFSCDLCPKYYIEQKGLTMHMLSHRNQRPHQCTYCDKNFIQKNHLDKHIRTHLGIKLYNCLICMKRFSSKASQEKHVEGHKERKNYSCQRCGLIFLSSHSLAAHSKTHSIKKKLKN